MVVKLAPVICSPFPSGPPGIDNPDPPDLRVLPAVPGALIFDHGDFGNLSRVTPRMTTMLKDLVKEHQESINLQLQRLHEDRLQLLDGSFVQLQDGMVKLLRDASPACYVDAASQTDSVTTVQVKENADILPVVAMKDNVKFTERKTLVFDRLGTAASSESAKKNLQKNGKKVRTSNLVSKTVAREHRQQMGMVTKVVRSNEFDVLSAVMILANALLLAAEVESDNSLTLNILQALFCAFFAVELSLRLISNGVQYAFRDLYWNLFDAVTVLTSAAEVVIKMAYPGRSTPNIVVLRFMRFLRFIRVAKVLRFNMFRELRLMIHSMMHSVKPLAWTVTILMMEVYIFSIVFTQAVRDKVASTNLSSSSSQMLHDNFFTISSSLRALLAAVLGGKDWMDFAVPLGELSTFYELLFVAYIFFTNLALLNVVTGIFVDSSLNAARSDRQMVIQEEMIRQGVHQNELKSLFQEADVAGTGRLTLSQLAEYLSDEHVKAYLKVLEITYKQPKDLFKTLDADQDGMIDADEFIKGCMQLKCEQAADLCSVVIEVKSHFHEIMNAISSVEQLIRSPGSNVDSQLSVTQSHTFNRAAISKLSAHKLHTWATLSKHSIDKLPKCEEAMIPI